MAPSKSVSEVVLLKDIPIPSEVLATRDKNPTIIETTPASLDNNPTPFESELLVMENPGVGTEVNGQCDVVSKVLEMERCGGQFNNHLASAGGLEYNFDGEVGGRGKR